MMHRRRHFGQRNIPIVAPLHACRREVAAFGCAVMVILPQTAPGVPAERKGSSPPRKSCSKSVMLQVSSRGSVLVRTDLTRVFGGGQPLPRDVAIVLATVRGNRIPQGEIQRDLTAPEVEQVAMVRCVARHEAKVLEVHTSYVELRGAKSSDSSESEEHNSWTPVLGLCFDCYVEWICHAALFWISSAMRAFSSSPKFLLTGAG